MCSGSNTIHSKGGGVNAISGQTRQNGEGLFSAADGRNGRDSQDRRFQYRGAKVRTECKTAAGNRGFTRRERVRFFRGIRPGKVEKKSRPARRQKGKWE